MVALVEGAIRSVSPFTDDERVGVVGEDAPLSPDLLALVALQAGSVQPVAAFEVTDPALGPGSVARSRRRVCREAGSWRPAMKIVLAPSSANAALVGVGWNPPSSATSRGVIPRRVSSVTLRAGACSRSGCRSDARPAGSTRAHHGACAR